MGTVGWCFKRVIRMLNISLEVEVVEVDAHVEETPEAAEAIKALPLKLTGTVPLDEAISTAGGVAWGARG